MRKVLFFLLWMLCVHSMSQRFRVLEYNCENLFDTIDNVLKNDNDFLPEGKMRWNSWRYWSKLGRIARVMAAVSGESPCALMGLCEVESDTVLRDLTKRTSLHHLGYEFIKTDSPDRRGINVALLYQPFVFQPVTVDTIRISGLFTRDVLHVGGRVMTGDTLDVFVCHLPSRRGGAKKTAENRLRVSKIIGEFADSLQRCRSSPKIIIMGDFNDEPRDKSVRYLARSFPLLTENMRARDGEIRGTYRFQQQWNQLDQVFVNKDLLPYVTSCRLYAADFLLEDSQGHAHPYRTYRGPFYHGGFSDHLPIILDLNFNGEGGAAVHF